MGLIASAPITGGFIVEGAYVRVRCIESVMKGEGGNFFAVADLAVYKDVAEGAKRAILLPAYDAYVDDDGVSHPSGEATLGEYNGERLQSKVDRVKAYDVDITQNLHTQLYAKLKADLTEQGITWSEE
jgi:hypothetical protein